MDKGPSLLRRTAVLVIFLLLEGACFLLISRNGIIQQYRCILAFRRIQTFFWEKAEARRYRLSLVRVNDSLAADNRFLLERIGRLESRTGGIPMPCLPDSSVYSDAAPFEFIPARVIRNETDRQHNVLLLDKGAEDGIEPDMGVITPKGIVGYVDAVSEHFCRVISLLDIDHGYSAVIRSCGTFAPLRWDGKDYRKAILDEIPVHTAFSPGDTVVSSGYSTLFPPGLPLGTISASRLVDGISFQATVTLFEDFRTLRFVYLVRNAGRSELDSLYRPEKHSAR